MKKIASVIAAGALLLSGATAVFASPVWGTTQGNFGTKTAVVSIVVSNSGLNSQQGEGLQVMTTGSTSAQSGVLSVANQNGLNSFGQTTQGNIKTKTLVLSAAVSNSGLNSQSGTSPFSKQIMHTGDSGTLSQVNSWANIDLNGMSITN